MRQMVSFADVLQSFASALVSTYKSHISTTRRLIDIPRLTIENLPNEIIHRIVNDAVVRTEPTFGWLATRTSLENLETSFCIRLLYGRLFR